MVHWPAYRIVPGPMRELKSAVAGLDRYDWIVFTSANGVRAFADCGAVPGSRIRIAAVGEATAAAVRALGWPVHLRPRRANGAALARAMIRRGMRARRVLFPRGERAAPELASSLEHAGARVDAVVAYRLRTVRRTRSRRAAPLLDAVTFTSPSTVDGLEARLGTAQLRTLLARTPAVVIGATTARALARRGVSAARQARPTTLAGLVAAVERAVGQHRPR